MRILFISFYFPPDLCAGSFRAGALVDALSEGLGGDVEIDVITTLPNRYASYAVEASKKEEHGSVAITRIAIPSHQSGMMDQSFAFAWFALRTWKEMKNKKYDIVLATTSRLMSGFLAAVISRRMNVPLYLDIRDIFTDTMEDILSGRLLSGVLPVFRLIERFTVQKASRINLVSEGFRSYFKEVDKDNKFVFFPNGIDEEFVAYDFHKQTRNSLPLIVYAGNVGEGQGLHEIIPHAAKHLESEYRFLIVGDGGMRRELEKRLNEFGVSNVQLHDPVSRPRLLELYKEADYLFLHLNAHEAFHKVLPSKIFEYAATGKPILAGVAGYPREFIEKHVKNAAVFDPCDSDGLVNAVRGLSPEIVNRDQFIEEFRRSTIMRKLAIDILSIAESGHLVTIH